MPLIATLERMLAAGRDDELLRFGLGNACLKAGRLEDAVRHLRRALEFEPGYSAAWKLLGRTLADLGCIDDAIAAFGTGIATARARGDVQSAREMEVFLRRLERGRGAGEAPERER